MCSTSSLTVGVLGDIDNLPDDTRDDGVVDIFSGVFIREDSDFLLVGDDNFNGSGGVWSFRAVSSSFSSLKDRIKWTWIFF